MILIFAHSGDHDAVALASRWSNVAVFTARDLARHGWTFSPIENRSSNREAQVPSTVPAYAAGRAVAGGATINAADISAVMIRWPGVYESDLWFIDGVDRPYVAAEMNAFLVAWLAALPARVLNRPGGTGLLAPGWRPERWTLEVTRLHIPARPVERVASIGNAVQSSELPKQELSVLVCGENTLGAPLPAIATDSLRIARHAGLELLRLRFEIFDGTHRFVAADSIPTLSVNEESFVFSALGSRAKVCR